MSRLTLFFLFFAGLLNASDDSQCITCHPAETKSFRSSAMGQSLQRGSTQPAGRVEHAPSSSTVIISNNHSQQLHKIDSKGLTAEYPVAYSVGSGKVGYSYLIALDDYLFQSPVSYYNQAKTWDVTPGYEFEHTLDFTHPITGGCVFCHSGESNFVAKTDNRFMQPALSPISCERCHGPSANHLKRPVPGSIVNPSRLDPARRDAVCEQCHLEGDVRILNPKKTWRDFEAGQKLEDVFVTYLRRHSPEEGIKAVSHAEQLSLSRCARESAGRLWCATCHNPHSAAADRNQEVRTACLTCHPQLFTAQKHQAAEECVTCHMPRLRPNNIAHAAVTDHLIALPAAIKSSIGARQPGVIDLSPWRSPASDLVDRDLGLATFQLAANNKDSRQILRAYEILSHLPVRDHEVLASIGSILLEQGYGAIAATLFQQAMSQQSQNARYPFLLGSALETQGKEQAAIEALRKSIAIDPSSPDPYRKLAEIYDKAGQTAQSRQVQRDYLKFMPQNFEFRRLQ